MTYSPEQYTVYYTTNSSGCPTNSDELGYNKSVTVYGLNHTDFFTIRDQQYNVTLNNLHPYTVYCYKVVATNSEGRNESMMRMFETNETSEGLTETKLHVFDYFLLYADPSGPPQNLTNSTTSINITLLWFPPLSSQRNGVIVNYLITCTIGGLKYSMRISETSQVVNINPFTNYTCSVSAATMVGDGPPATVSGTSDEDGEYIIHYSYCDITHDVLYSTCRTTSSGLYYCRQLKINKR